MPKYVKLETYNLYYTKIEELIEICKKQQEIINDLKFEISLKEALISKQQELLEAYKKENFDLKREPLKNINDLIKHI